VPAVEPSTRVVLGHAPDGLPVAWDWYRDPNLLVGGAAGWGKTFAAKGIMSGMLAASRQGKGGGLVVWNPKRVGVDRLGAAPAPAGLEVGLPALERGQPVAR